jgi:Methyl-accepting chemotaxis protein
MKSIRLKIVVLILFLIIGVSSAIGIMSYNISSNQLKANVNTTLPELAKQGATLVDNYLQKEWSVLQSMALNDIMLDPAATLTEKNAYLKREVERSGAINIAFADTSGDSLAPDGVTATNIKDRPYFQEAMKGNCAVSDPIENKTDPGNIIMVFAVPVKNNDQIIGVLFKVADANALSAITNQLTFGKNGKAFMINKSGTAVAHYDNSFVLKADNALKNSEKDKAFKSMAQMYQKVFEGKNTYGNYVYKNDIKYAGFAPVNNNNWFVVITIPKDEILSGLNTMKTLIVLWSLILLAIFVAVGVVIAGFISKPIAIITNNLNQMSTGDLSVEIFSKVLNIKDETGRLAKALHTMQNSFRDLIGAVQKEAGDVDMNASIEENTVRDLLRELEEVSATTQELSAGSEETAASAQEMNASSAEIMQAIDSIAQKAQEGSDTANEISKRAEELRISSLDSKSIATSIYSDSEKILKKAIEQSKDVNQINNLSKAILEITSQTNLLALNASIEAARAGEAGKGFAVVAEEIRNLAENSNKTVSEIQKVTENVILAVENLADSSNKLLEFVDTKVIRDYEKFVNTSEQYHKDAVTVDNFVTDLSATTEELSASMENMIKAVNEVTTATNEAASGASLIAEKTVIVTDKANSVSEYANKTKDSSARLVDAISKYKIR